MSSGRGRGLVRPAAFPSSAAAPFSFLDGLSSCSLPLPPSICRRLHPQWVVAVELHRVQRRQMRRWACPDMEVVDAQLSRRWHASSAQVLAQCSFRLQGNRRRRRGARRFDSTSTPSKETPQDGK